MKKLTFLIISGILFLYVSACAGYTPIYSSSQFNFIIENHSIKGEERLANLIYRKLYNVSLSNKDNLNTHSISLSILTTKEKKPTIKNSAGKILEYEINLNSNIVINEFSQSKFTPEALYREIEIYYTLGMIDDAKKTSAVIGYNYPKSKWYKYSYKLLKKNDGGENKESLLKKISKFLTNDDKKE